VAIGAVAGITSVLVVMMLGQIRVFFAMSRDHLHESLVVNCAPALWHASPCTILTGIAVATLCCPDSHR